MTSRRAKSLRMGGETARWAATIGLLALAGGALLLRRVVRNDLPLGLFPVRYPEAVAADLLERWAQLPVYDGQGPLDLRSHSLVVAVTFDLGGCAVCLPGVDHLLQLVDSLARQTDVRLIAIAVDTRPEKLKRYLAVAPKPCPVLLEEESLEGWPCARAAPAMVIIDRRSNTRVLTAPVGPGPVPGRERELLVRLLTGRG